MNGVRAAVGEAVRASGVERSRRAGVGAEIVAYLALVGQSSSSCTSKLPRPAADAQADGTRAHDLLLAKVGALRFLGDRPPLLMGWLDNAVEILDVIAEQIDIVSGAVR